MARIKSRAGTPRQRAKMLAENPRCHWCGTSLDMTTSTIDHVTPLSKGGKDRPGNMVLACDGCNKGKAAGLWRKIKRAKATLTHATCRLCGQQLWMARDGDVYRVWCPYMMCRNHRRKTTAHTAEQAIRKHGVTCDE